MEHSHSERCGELLDALSAYLDGELDPQISSRIEEHLARCAQCVQFVVSLRSTVALSKAYRLNESPCSLPDSFKQELLSAYRKAMLQRPPAGAA